MPWRSLPTAPRRAQRPHARGKHLPGPWQPEAEARQALREGQAEGQAPGTGAVCAAEEQQETEPKAQSRPGPEGSPMNQENRNMRKRIAKLGVTIGTTVLMLVALPMAAQAAESPWWQVLTSSRPGNMWEPAANVQEIESQKSPDTGVLAAEIKVEGSVIGCLGAG